MLPYVISKGFSNSNCVTTSLTKSIGMKSMHRCLRERSYLLSLRGSGQARPPYSRAKRIKWETLGSPLITANVLKRIGGRLFGQPVNGTRETSPGCLAACDGREEGSWRDIPWV